MEAKKVIVANGDEELREIIKQEIEKYGNNADLNHIDVSKVRVMSYLFKNSDFNGDISKWDVSNVVNMVRMFIGSKFNGDISNWNTAKVQVSNNMFDDSAYKGNGISNYFQYKALHKIYNEALYAPHFKPNEKYSSSNATISYDDIMNNKYIIRASGEEIMVEYKSIEELVDDGWRLV